MSMFRCQTSRRCLQRAFHPAPLPLTRPLSTTTSLRFPAKNTQDKDSLQPQSTEYSKSGSDDAAAHEEDAFNPDKTRPEQQQSNAKTEHGGGSLNVSPDNPDISKPKGQHGGTGTGGAPEKKSSGGGSAPKSGGSSSG